MQLYETWYQGARWGTRKVRRGGKITRANPDHEINWRVACFSSRSILNGTRRMASRKSLASQKCSRYRRFNPAGASEFPRRLPLTLPLKSTAPRKRSMVAWRRRPNPRVMQCPRQGFVWREGKRLNAAEMNSPANLHAETGALRRTYLLARAGWS